MIQFTIYGEPVAQGRPRATMIAGKARMYDPSKSRGYKEYVKLAAADHAPAALLEGPLVLTVNVYRSIPKSYSNKKKTQAEAGEIRPTSKPDVDNYVKGIKDALNKVIWKDDSQVVSITAGKFYSQKPRIEVKVQVLEEQTQQLSVI
ncbi:Holliday junction resolvase RusA-like endonuclease [Aneurinibacillus soli]|uniref:Endodeoxyribonuclease RusA n=1 Tax=Aneurinibacillus soli TaxID=1500254 RepID=A0A0U5AV32_9BACL|nr:RusA family crossover junction endodeoxyribonuclease [Aneurinibacillus soli]PYE63458.1 Holliday junction resolvase RusA-like endonuclease [Aneurinibacillus soli]BAU27610.1 Endodeoxyribonuclease RusA [Aneurinibacillus soli]